MWQPLWAGSFAGSWAGTNIMSWVFPSHVGQWITLMEKCDVDIHNTCFNILNVYVVKFMFHHTISHRVLLFSKEGNLYAKRQCRSKIFWTSTQQPSLKQAIELPRDTVTKIFDWKEFEIELGIAYGAHTLGDMVPPCVRFSFAQKWNIESETFHTKLVTARIEPSKSMETLRWAYPNVGPASHQDSHHTGNILISDHWSCWGESLFTDVANRVCSWNKKKRDLSVIVLPPTTAITSQCHFRRDFSCWESFDKDVKEIIYTIIPYPLLSWH